MSGLQAEILYCDSEHTWVNNHRATSIFSCPSLNNIGRFKKIFFKSGFLDNNQVRHEAHHESMQSKHLAQESLYVL